MTSDFKRCFSFVLQHEATYDAKGNMICEHDPKDPGGTTKGGIDQRDHPHVNVCALTEAQIAQIYHDIEWTRSRSDDLPNAWDLIVFDSSVNPGLGFSIPTLQKVVGATVDGWIGPKTIAAVNAHATDRAAMNQYLSLRESYYNMRPKRLRTEFLRGWLNRVADLRQTLALPT